MDKSVLMAKGYDVLKACILVIWYLILLTTASVAYTGKASDMLASFSDVFADNTFYSSYEDYTDELPDTPLSYLRDTFSGVAPAYILIDVLNTLVPGWEDGANYDGEDMGLTLAQEERYFLLFVAVDNYLESLVEQEKSNLDGVDFDTAVIPKYYDHLLTKEDAPLPTSVKIWIQKQIILNSESSSKTSIVDTFLILVVLGVFGSLIFLTKDLLADDDENSLLAYTFRPVFGMALSIAVFIVAILAHALMTTAPMEEIRTETMYILGLASGLLADRAYEFLKSKAARQFDKLEKQHEPSDP